MRLDKELVLRGYFETRNRALQAILDGIIFCDGKKISKPAYKVNSNTTIELRGSPLKYVSKGGLKLENAIEIFKLDFENKVVLDIGSSTGGFVDCAIQHGAAKVFGVDVGKNQMSSKLVSNDKLELYEETDIRKIDIDKIISSEIVTIDVSFISVKKIISTIVSLPKLEEVICLIKPQFECGKEVADKYKGIVLDKKIHINIIEDILIEFENNGLYCQGVIYSPIKGGSGNIEYLAHFNKNPTYKKFNYSEVVKSAFLNFKK